jgi:hypothetical protein
MGMLQKVMLQACNLHNNFVFAQLMTGVSHIITCALLTDIVITLNLMGLYIEYWVGINWRQTTIKVMYAMIVNEIFVLIKVSC